MSGDDREITIRACVSAEDYAAVYAMQIATWGPDGAVLVSTPILKVGQRVGGLTAGAFDASGQLRGFVFGLTGPQNGRLVHWSDMLAVDATLRDQGLGRRLKAFQRAHCLSIGVHAMQWTYDPLVARNAHLNLNRLGAFPVEYVRDMYADSGSVLHVGLGTDRFVVEWPLDEGEMLPGRFMLDAVASVEGPIEQAALISWASGEDLRPIVQRNAVVRIAIPTDIHDVVATDPGAATGWRNSTRAALEHCLASGYRIVGLHRTDRDTAYCAVREDIFRQALAAARSVASSRSKD
jgi:chorismate synthase